MQTIKGIEIIKDKVLDSTFKEFKYFFKIYDAKYYLVRLYEML